MRKINDTNFANLGSSWFVPDDVVHLWDGNDIKVESDNLGGIGYVAGDIARLVVEYFNTGVSEIREFTSPVFHDGVKNKVVFYIPIEHRYLDYWRRLSGGTETAVRIAVKKKGTTDMSMDDPIVFWVFRPYLYGASELEPTSPAIPVVFWNKNGVKYPSSLLNGQQLRQDRGSNAILNGFNFITTAGWHGVQPTDTLTVERFHAYAGTPQAIDYKVIRIRSNTPPPTGQRRGLYTVAQKPANESWRNKQFWAYFEQRAFQREGQVTENTAGRFYTLRILISYYDNMGVQIGTTVTYNPSWVPWQGTNGNMQGICPMSTTITTPDVSGIDKIKIELSNDTSQAVLDLCIRVAMFTSDITKIQDQLAPINHIPNSKRWDNVHIPITEYYKLNNLLNISITELPGGIRAARASGGMPRVSVIPPQRVTVYYISGYLNLEGGSINGTLGIRSKSSSWSEAINGWVWGWASGSLTLDQYYFLLGSSNNIINFHSLALTTDEPTAPLNAIHPLDLLSPEVDGIAVVSNKGTTAVTTTAEITEGSLSLLNQADSRPVMLSSADGLLLREVCPDSAVNLKWFEVKSKAIRSYWFQVVEDEYNSEKSGEFRYGSNTHGITHPNERTLTGTIFRPTKKITVTSGVLPNSVITKLMSIARSPEIYMRVGEGYVGAWNNMQPTREGLAFPYMLADIDRQAITHVLHDHKMSEIKLTITLPTYTPNNLIL